MCWIRQPMCKRGASGATLENGMHEQRIGTPESNTFDHDETSAI